MTVAETLRKAADYLRHFADTATPGEWRARSHMGGGKPDCDQVYVHGTDTPVATTDTFATALYLHLVRPDVGRWLADWLDANARQADAMTHDSHWGICDAPSEAQAAYDLARLVLGGAR